MLKFKKFILFRDEKKYKLRGFSLAEALITLLIISTVVAMSTVMLAKKSKIKQEKNESHYWSCVLTGSSSYKSHHCKSDVPSTCKSVSSYCTFVPPKNVKKFNVMSIGGGGGGAAGTSTVNATVLTSGTKTYVPAVSGTYYIIVIGGGGAGGGNAGRCCNGQAGGSGGIIAGTFDLNAGETYTMTVGNGGNSDSHNSGHQGGDSSFKGGSLNLIGGGGHGGSGRWKCGLRGCCGSGGRGNGGSHSGGPGKDGEAGSLSGNTQSASTGGPRSCGGPPGYVCKNSLSRCRIDGIWDMLNGFNREEIGRGGKPSGGSGEVGRAGLVYVIYTPIYGGGAGSAGSQSFYTYNRSPGEVKVYVGKGGNGAAAEDTPGSKGEATRFEGRVIADGGAGGIIKANEISVQNADDKAPGQTGAISSAPRDMKHTSYNFTEAFGGYTSSNSNIHGKSTSAPGAGGGGGGADMRNYGKGGNGGDGLVYITW